MEKILNKIESPDDLKKLNKDELKTLCSEIREFLIDSVSETGGHLASNLGIVELTVAIHTVFNVPEDKIVFDVGLSLIHISIRLVFSTFLLLHRLGRQVL